MPAKVRTRRGSLSSSAEPERVREPPRRVDRHHGDLAALLGSPSATAAAVVVLPTPPEPAQMTMRRPSSSGSRCRQHANKAYERQMRPSRTANATACERLRALSFVTTSCSTFFTVRSE